MGLIRSRTTHRALNDLFEVGRGGNHDEHDLTATEGAIVSTTVAPYASSGSVFDLVRFHTLT
jgi:hypothetical protein